MDSRWLDARRLLASLGHDSRFRLVALLMERECCVTELARQVGLSQSCTTRHLQTLTRHGIVHRSRQGKRVMFRLCSDHPQVGPLVTWALSPPEPAEVSNQTTLGRTLARHGSAGPSPRSRSRARLDDQDAPGVAPRAEPQAADGEGLRVESSVASQPDEPPLSPPRPRDLEDYLL